MQSTGPGWQTSHTVYLPATIAPVAKVLWQLTLSATLCGLTAIFTSYTSSPVTGVATVTSAFVQVTSSASVDALSFESMEVRMPTSRHERVKIFMLTKVASYGVPHMRVERSTCSVGKAVFGSVHSDPRMNPVVGP